MAANFNSKHGIVRKDPSELYMAFVDMRNFKNMLPADKQEGVNATYDTISASVQGFNIGIKVRERRAFNLIVLEDDGAPFKFSISIHFDSTGVPAQTDFHIDVEADLNMMMKMMLGKHIQEALDKIIDGIAGSC